MSRLEKVYRPISPWMKRRPGLLEEGLWHPVAHCQKCTLLVVYPKEPMIFHQGHCIVHWRKGNDQNFQEPLDTGSERTLIPGTQTSLWPQSVWTSGDQWSFGAGPYHRGLSGSRNPHCGYFPSSRMHNWSRQSHRAGRIPTRSGLLLGWRRARRTSQFQWNQFSSVLPSHQPRYLFLKHASHLSSGCPVTPVTHHQA